MDPVSGERRGAPSAEAQLSFLAKIQRLFAEGDFTATYKFALLVALSDLAVELGADDGSELVLSIRQIGHRFIELYWTHASPYQVEVGEVQAGVLSQNLGSQAVVVSALAAFRARSAANSPQAALTDPGYPGLLRLVSQAVSAQPINYLQNFGGATDEFLFERAGAGKIRLKQGVAYCLRRFQPLVQQVARSQWIAHIKANNRNQDLLGGKDDLEAFLFLSSRRSLKALGERLREIDGPVCFYCRSGIATADVDHFIPFSLYPRDLVHNFVLAHPACNRSKSAMLAGKVHLERWLTRLNLHAEGLSRIGGEIGFVTEPESCQHVAAWAYLNGHASGASAWIDRNKLEAISRQYLECFDQSIRGSSERAFPVSTTPEINPPDEMSS